MVLYVETFYNFLNPFNESILASSSEYTICPESKVLGSTPSSKVALLNR